MVNRSLLHLKQGELDGACGTHCALMALMVFGIIKRDELDDISKVRKKPLSKLWMRTTQYYFSGINPHQLKSVFLPYQEHVHCKVLQSDLVEQTIKLLKQDGVCIIAINNEDFRHWVLAVGFSGKNWTKQDAAETILILDPDSPPIPMLAWNGTITVKTFKNGQHRYEAADGSVNVSIDAVLALKHIGAASKKSAGYGSEAEANAEFELELDLDDDMDPESIAAMDREIDFLLSLDQ